MSAGYITALIEKGFGFIRSSSLEGTVYFHSKELVGVCFDELRCGDGVNFELVELGKGFAAIRVGRDGESPPLNSQHELTASPPIIIVKALQECNAELVEYLTSHPDALRDLHPGTFENIVAEIYRHEGFTTERITGWNQPDGGVDLIAVRHISPGLDIRLAIQCKRWGQSRRLSAEPIRTLAGVLDRFRAHAGVVATTGFFSEAAEEEMASYLWSISLRNYNDILASLERLRVMDSPGVRDSTGQSLNVDGNE